MHGTAKERAFSSLFLLVFEGFSRNQCFAKKEEEQMEWAGWRRGWQGHVWRGAGLQTVRAQTGSSLLLALCERPEFRQSHGCFRMRQAVLASTSAPHSCWEEPLTASLLLFCIQADPVYLQALQQSSVSASHHSGKGGGDASHPCSAELLGTWHQCEVP